MAKRKSLYKIQEMVFAELCLRPETRSSDRVLIENLYRDYFGITNESFTAVMHRADLPKFESIRRCRQKLQEDNEGLRAVPDVELKRIDEQQEYIAFARGE